MYNYFGNSSEKHPTGTVIQAPFASSPALSKYFITIAIDHTLLGRMTPHLYAKPYTNISDDRWQNDKRIELPVFLTGLTKQTGKILGLKFKCAVFDIDKNKTTFPEIITTRFENDVGIDIGSPVLKESINPREKGELQLLGIVCGYASDLLSKEIAIIPAQSLAERYKMQFFAPRQV